MAWQLIYTSAPRLLEAGRSGFGSVARHRQISPLLVSAIERASQFSRQPGMDPGRVIFSHRIIPISGARYHVLSCIRDAGADYTGRTNHIAHHVIAEAREAAQLGAQGASPADVLLIMPWVARWDEPPCYFEAADEVILADFTPQTGDDGTHWVPVTGSAAHAWLLAAGEASRGAYVIPPPGVDLRWLFADSLRLAPERLWQTSFTTSLQSKDEISDYRWIGVESGSPLRNEAAISGRPVLDLRSPASLPQPEIPVAQFAQTPMSLPDSVKIKTQVNGVDERTPGSVEKLLRRQEFPAQDARRSAPEQRTQWDEGACQPGRLRLQVPRWAWIAAAAVLIPASLGFFVVKPIFAQSNARKDIAGSLEHSVFGDESARMRIATLLLPKLLPDSHSLERATESAKAIDRIATTLMSGTFEGVTPKDKEQLRGLAGNGASAEITSLYNVLTAAEERSSWTPSLTSPSQAPEMQRQISAQVNKQIPKPPYYLLNKTLSESSDEKIAKAEYDILAGTIRPSESTKTFDKSITELKDLMSNSGGAMVFLNKAKSLHGIWESTESTSPPTPEAIADLKKKLAESKEKIPAWLSEKINKLPRTDAGTTFKLQSVSEKKVPRGIPPVPLYFVSSIASLKGSEFPELRKTLTYILQSPIGAKDIKLLDLKANGELRLEASSNALIFAVRQVPPQLVPDAASASLETPLVVVGKDDSKNETIRIYVAAASDKPLFLPLGKTVLTCAGNILNIDFEKFALPGNIKSTLKLVLPEQYTTHGLLDGFLPLVDGKADLGLFRKQIDQKRAEREKEAAEIRNRITRERRIRPINFANRKDIVIKAANLEKELKIKDSQTSKDLGNASDPLFQQCGNLIVAVMHKTQISGAQGLLNIGDDLSKLDPQSAQEITNEKLSSASARTAELIASLKDDLDKAIRDENIDAHSEREKIVAKQRITLLKNAKGNYEPGLIKLKELIDSLLESPQARLARMAAETQLTERLKFLEREVSELSTNPLLSLPADRVPPGNYQLIAETEPAKPVLLLKIEVAQ